MLAPANLKTQGREWEKARKIVRHEFMPPVGVVLPSPAERKAITDWIAKEVFGVDFARPDPGRSANHSPTPLSGSSPPSCLGYFVVQPPLTHHAFSLGT